MDIEELEASKNELEAQVQTLRARMRDIRAQLEPLYVARNREGLSGTTTVLKVGN